MTAHSADDKNSPPKEALLGVQLCIFCEHFSWSKEEQWGMGSTMTGPMMSGGDAVCAKGHFDERPESDDDWRRIILHAVKCPDFKERA